MKRFQNILYVNFGNSRETEGLKQALKLAQDNNAELTIVSVYPEFPEFLQELKSNFNDFLKEQFLKSFKITISDLKTTKSKVPFIFESIEGSCPATRIIQKVITNSFDLVIKEAETKEDSKGFKAIDMELLRKCPCPVWLCKPMTHSHQDTRVAVAIDPMSMDKAGHDLSIKLLELSRSLSNKFDKKLKIISCWIFEFEEFFRRSARVRTTEEELKKTALEIESEHKRALQKLIYESGIDGEMQIIHVKGRPDEVIPIHVEEHKVDILVMGTVARSGIVGFIMGNTAENIIQKLSCTLLAVKPNGFVSPVKLY